MIEQLYLAIIKLELYKNHYASFTKACAITANVRIPISNFLYIFNPFVKYDQDLSENHVL